jgi:hypothetical protein
MPLAVDMLRLCYAADLQQSKHTYVKFVSAKWQAWLLHNTCASSTWPDSGVQPYDSADFCYACPWLPSCSGGIMRQICSRANIHTSSVFLHIGRLGCCIIHMQSAFDPMVWCSHMAVLTTAVHAPGCRHAQVVLCGRFAAEQTYI